jgi:aspartate-semialdehyde dehydrogenase
MKKYNLSVVGATGAVGLDILSILEERSFPINELKLFASPKSLGKIIKFKGKNIRIQTLNQDCFFGTDIAFFSSGGAISREWAPIAVQSGAMVVDKSSVFRMDKNIPLVVPEVNGYALKNYRGIIANPNCVAIPLVMALKPLYDYSRIKRIVVSTYQAVSGAGLKAVYEMERETKSQVCSTKLDIRNRIFPRQIAFNAIPQIPQSNAFEKDGYTGEEDKIIKETKKILGDNSLQITVTCVRIPVYRGHSSSVNIEFTKPITPEKARNLLGKFPGVKVWDNTSKELYPTPVDVDGRDEVFIGRIRKDPTIKNGLNLWVVADNLRKGAALNGIQIAEALIKNS